jgi:hypothetical protein
MNHPLRCQCGTLRGQVSQPEKGTRIVCYCKDCQAFAAYLGNAGGILDALGGTDVISVHPQSVTFTDGKEALACVSLSESGLLRWYASCCNTPIGNTPRDFRMAFVGLVHSCLDDGTGSLDSAFGPVRMRTGAKGARGQPASSPWRGAATMAGFVASLLRARLNGSYRRTPFFNVEQGTPVVAPKVLTAQQRAQLAQSSPAA